MAKKTIKKAVKTAKKPVKKVAKKASKTVALKKTAKKAIKKAITKKTKVAVTKKQALKKLSPKKAVKKTAPKTKFIAHSTSLKQGDKAPYFEGKDQNGNLITLNNLAGKTIILYFYPKDNTPGCTATACSLRDEFKYLSDKNYAVVGVSADDEKSHAKFASKYNLPFPLIADTDKKVMKAYGVWGKKMFMGRIFDGIIRTTFIISTNGIIQEVIKSVDTANHAKQILS
ncbi:MAG: thioredoxin-dependent thiol peroxidase [Bacteroidia bacterium]